MVKEKFNELLVVMERLLMQEGYQKGRKKGTYQKAVSGKIIKLRLILGSVRQHGNLGEIGAFAALEYPEVEELVSALKDEQYKKGKNIFEQQIGALCEKSNVFFLISGDSDMESVGAMIWAYLARFVFPLMREYEDDHRLLGKFAGKTTAWRWNYSSMAKSDIDFYLKWIALCVLTGHIREAFLVLENIPKWHPCHLTIETNVLKERLGVLCSGRKQVKSRSLLFDGRVFIDPGKEELEKAILELDGLMLYYLILEDSVGGNYLQIAGGSGEYTLEIRLYQGQEYTHYRAETNSGNTQKRTIFYGHTNITLQADQVLSFDQVYEIVCRYLDGQELLHSAYHWTTLDI